MKLSTVLDPTINFTLGERVSRLGEWAGRKIAHHLPETIKYYAFIDFAAARIHDDEIVPEVTIMEVLERADEPPTNGLMETWEEVKHRLALVVEEAKAEWTSVMDRPVTLIRADGTVHAFDNSEAMLNYIDSRFLVVTEEVDGRVIFRELPHSGPVDLIGEDGGK